jgi:hypothetical protein
MNNPIEEINKNFEKVKSSLNGSISNSEDFVFVSNTLNTVTVTTTCLDNKTTSCKDIGVDTKDLCEDVSFDFEILKKNYLNNMISWSFLKKISDFNQWPLGCIGNFIENSFKEEVNAKNIFIDVKSYDKKIYTKGIKDIKPEDLATVNDFSDKVIVLSITDDGNGININDFNQIMYSFSTNEKKEHNFFKFGISMKTSAIRLANSFLILTKTENEASIGLLSKNMQIKLDTDFILSPIVNFKINHTIKINDIEAEGWNKKYIPRSNLAIQSLNLILVEIRFLFKNEYDLFNYFESFETGTHILLCDLKQISLNKKELNQLTNYELFFDYENKDILFNLFYIQTGERNYIDCSLKNYIKFIFLKHVNKNLFLYGRKVSLINPLLSVYNISKNVPEAVKIGFNLKTEIKKSDCMLIDGEIYKGILMNENYFESLSKTYNFNFDTSYEEKEIFNGVLLYRNNRLVSRLEQNKLGDISFFIRKYEKLTLKENFEQFFFPVSGYIELPTSCYELLYNKMVKIEYFYSSKIGIQGPSDVFLFLLKDKKSYAKN